MFDEDFYSGYVQTIGGFDDCIMRKAINMVSTPMYSLVGRAFLGFQDKYNCQDFCADLRRKYEEIKDDSAIKKQCCKESR